MKKLTIFKSGNVGIITGNFRSRFLSKGEPLEEYDITDLPDEKIEELKQLGKKDKKARKEILNTFKKNNAVRIIAKVNENPDNRIREVSIRREIITPNEKIKTREKIWPREYASSTEKVTGEQSPLRERMTTTSKLS